MARRSMNRDCPREFNPAEPADKKPRGGEARGAGKGNGSAYFFATKMNFANCDLWFEAELRWMTLLLTALSRAEL